MSTSNLLEVRIAEMADVGTAMRLMAGRLKLSLTKMVEAGGVQNGSLIGIGTGSRKTKDMSLVPLLRLLRAVNWEMAGRVRDPRGIVIYPEGAVELLITAPDGARIEVPIGALSDVAVLLNTMAAANALTVTGLNKKAKLGGASLVALAKNSGPYDDIRLRGLLQIVEAAQFELLIRPRHATRREARHATLPTRSDAKAT